jgi:hypothetical protein
MTFRRVHTNYDPKTGRAYVELRERDGDGGEIIVTAIFSYRTTGGLSNTQIEREVRLKAMHAFKRASEAK